MALNLKSETGVDEGEILKIAMMKTVLSFGEALWDLLPDGPALGGAPCNFAYRIHERGDRVLLASRLGVDELGEKAWAQLQAKGMDLSLIQRDATHPTGTVKVTFDENRNPDYFIVRDVAYDFLETTQPLLAAAAEADCVCFGTLVQRAKPARQSLRKVLDAALQAIKFYDVNLRKNCYSEETITDSLSRAGVLKLNHDESRYLAELFGFSKDSLVQFSEQMIARWTLSHCLVTLGAKGVFAVSRAGEKVYEPGYKIEVVDPTGAGDACSAGFVHALLQGKSLADCCRLGNALGSLVAAQNGATEPVSQGDIDDFLGKDGERLIQPELEAFSPMS